MFRVSGPLPLWKAIALVPGPSEGLLIGVTDEGWELLALAQGLSPLGVHPKRTAKELSELPFKARTLRPLGFQVAPLSRWYNS